MNEYLLDYWLRIIKPLLPTNAWVDSRHCNLLSGLSFWLLVKLVF